MLSVPLTKRLKICIRELLLRNYLLKEKLKLQRNFERMFLRLEVMVYNNLKPEGHIFCSSNWVFFTSTHNFEVFLRIVYLSSVQDLIALFDMVKLYLAK